MQNELSYEELQAAWPLLTLSERLEGFQLLVPAEADDFFLNLNARNQAELLLALPEGERRLWLRLLAPDDAADVIQETPPAERASLLALLDDSTRTEVTALLSYAEDEAGGLMNPRYARVRPEMTINEAISYLRQSIDQGFADIRYMQRDPDLLSLHADARFAALIQTANAQIAAAQHRD